MFCKFTFLSKLPHMGMTKIISEMAVFHAKRSMKTNFARKFVIIFHWVKQQKTISSPNVDTINICPGASYRENILCHLGDN